MGWGNSSKNLLLLEVSEEFKKNLEKFIFEETKKNLILAREKFFQDYEKVLEEYRKFFEDIKKNVEREDIETRSQINLYLQKVGQEIIKIQKYGLEGEEKLASFIQGKINDFSKKIDQTISAVEKSLTTETKLKSEQIIKSLIEEISDFSRMLKEELKEEIEAYKKNKIKELDEKFYLVWNETMKKLMGKVIDISTHEELVLQALEKAKEEILKSQ